MDNLQQFTIILVAPQRAENVGAAARAMKTMGLTSLRIVNSEIHQSAEAKWVAHGAEEILLASQVFPSLTEALHDVDYSIATTARRRGQFHHYLPIQEINTILIERCSWCQHIAIIFGCEESGLSNELLTHADLLSYVPMSADYPSLNLGQSVMLYCYQLSTFLPKINMAVRDIPQEYQQLSVLRQRCLNLVHVLMKDDDIKLINWLNQRMGYLSQRDVAMLHRLLNDIEKIFQTKS